MAKAQAFESLFPTSAIVPPEAIREYCEQTVKKAAELNRSMFNSVSQALEGNFDLATRLIRCNDPAEAMLAYKEWLTARRDALLADGKGLAAQWMKFCDIELAMAANVARRASDQVQTNISTMPRAAAGN
jgi:hypothetical protein